MHNFVFDCTELCEIYEYCGTVLKLDQIVYGLDKDVQKLDLISVFSRVLLDNLEPDVGIIAMTRVLGRLTPGWPGPNGPSVSTGFLIEQWGGSIDFVTDYHTHRDLDLGYQNEPGPSKRRSSPPKRKPCEGTGEGEKKTTN